MVAKKLKFILILIAIVLVATLLICFVAHKIRYAMSGIGMFDISPMKYRKAFQLVADRSLEFYKNYGIKDGARNVGVYLMDGEWHIVPSSDPEYKPYDVPATEEEIEAYNTVANAFAESKECHGLSIIRAYEGGTVQFMCGGGYYNVIYTENGRKPTDSIFAGTVWETRDITVFRLSSKWFHCVGEWEE